MIKIIYEIHDMCDIILYICMLQHYHLNESKIAHVTWPILTCLIMSGLWYFEISQHLTSPSKDHSVQFS